MKTMRGAVISLAMLLLFAPLLRAQDLSKYRDFSLGMSLAELSKRIDARPVDVKVVHQRPALIEELTWWPRLSGYPPKPEAIREVHFSFCDGKLYRIYVTYDDKATEGMTTDDMVRAVSARYGAPGMPDASLSISAGGFGTTEKVLGRWEDAQYSVNLLQPSSYSTFALVLFAKQQNTEAEVAIAAAAKLELENAPQNAIDQKKKDADNLEALRVKNTKAFHP
jgi:hypothetical protein